MSTPSNTGKRPRMPAGGLTAVPGPSSQSTPVPAQQAASSATQAAPAPGQRAPAAVLNLTIAAPGTVQQGVGPARGYFSAVSDTNSGPTTDPGSTSDSGPDSTSDSGPGSARDSGPGSARDSGSGPATGAPLIMQALPAPTQQVIPAPAQQAAAPVLPAGECPTQGFNAFQEMQVLLERTERLEQRETEQTTMLRKARAYATRRSSAFDPTTMSALLKALAEAASMAGHRSASTWTYAASAFDRQLEEGADLGGGDLESLPAEFIGDPEQISNTPRVWMPAEKCTSCGYSNDFTFKFCQQCGAYRPTQDQLENTKLLSVNEVQLEARLHEVLHRVKLCVMGGAIRSY
ncbi:Hypp6948 [Branchiostoma lanceolatum]|uniref:Hypp6948 protein n=1 Tax=Branchiostoma lanceolatum TaxID=7740 RepID=A0A8J9YVY3_BRALA|nr:Hypp6948 [Branchiostoma lanceolatum]